MLFGYKYIFLGIVVIVCVTYFPFWTCNKKYIPLKLIYNCCLILQVNHYKYICENQIEIKLKLND